MTDGVCLDRVLFVRKKRSRAFSLRYDSHYTIKYPEVSQLFEQKKYRFYAGV